MPYFRALVRTRENLMAVPYSPDLALCGLARESGVADDYLYDPLCGLQALVWP
ncbi:hypothetical protein FB451DRAFT_1404411 [Mycena latifolia]|nr:hypothetical protein FB451DRAFT_1404411 [Mycena latifolia]